MSIDVSSRGLRRVADSAESNTQSAENKIPEQTAASSQQEAAMPKLENQNAEAANSRRVEAGVKANHLQSQLLNQTNSTGTNRANRAPGSHDADFQKALKMYGITNDQLQDYVKTGKEPEGLKKAINVARTQGDWSAVNIVRASFQKRAEYLRANSSPNDKEIRTHADQLDAESANLTRNGNQIRFERAKGKLEALNTKYPDYSTRSENIQKQIDQTRKEFEYISSEIADQVNAHIEKNSNAVT